MNEIEVGRVLAFAAAQDPKMPQGDPDGFIRRTWATILADVPADLAQRAVVAYYSGDYYATSREPIVPAVIVQWCNARRRPSDAERTGNHNPATRRALPRPPLDPDRIRNGIDLVLATLDARRALPTGAAADHVLAAALSDEHQGEAGARRLIRNTTCPHCHAQPGQPCHTNGKTLTKSPAHPARIEAATRSGSENRA